MLGESYRLDQRASERITEAVLESGEYQRWTPAAERRRVRRQLLKFRYYNFIRHRTKPRVVCSDLAVWRSDLEAINGFDEKFFGWGCEDDDLGIRLRQAGVRFKSILPWTQTYHLWHPTDPTAPKRRWIDGANARYLLRPYRLTHCLDGLMKHGLADLPVRVAGQPRDTEKVAARLREHLAGSATAGNAEVELLFLPGEGSFSGQTRCRILVVDDGAALPRASRLARQAHIVVADKPLTHGTAAVQFPLSKFSEALRAAV
jgi:hypothetical protein